MLVSREQVIRCIRDHGWVFDRHSARGRHNELWRHKNNSQRLCLPTRATYPEPLLRLVLAQAGCTPAQVEQFLRDAVKATN